MELLRWCRLQWDRVLAVGAFASGVLALVLGWVGASGTEFVAKQVPYIVSGGLGGLVLLMIGGTLWLSADFRDEWRALDRLEGRLSADVGEGWRALDRLEHRLTGEEGMVDTLQRRLSLLESAASEKTEPGEPPHDGEAAHAMASLSAVPGAACDSPGHGGSGSHRRPAP